MSLRRWVACAAALVSFFSRSRGARADELEWSTNWPKFRLSEGIATTMLLGGTVALNYAPVHEAATFRGGLLFDDWVREHLRGETRAAQENAAHITDYIYKGSLGVPLVDVGVASLRGSSSVAAQMFLIDLEALGLSGALSVGLEHAVGRGRPYTRDCGPDGKIRDSSGRLLFEACGGKEDNQSFFSGHTAAAATVAGLTCVHHQHLALYGGGLADALPCGLMISASLADGVGRIVADKHYASDVLVGLGVGAISGYVVPSALHYGFGRERSQSSELTLVLAPQVYDAGAGLGVAGLF